MRTNICLAEVPNTVFAYRKEHKEQMRKTISKSTGNRSSMINHDKSILLCETCVRQAKQPKEYNSYTLVFLSHAHEVKVKTYEYVQ